jgi:glutaryl-CoA dehydrogenase
MTEMGELGLLGVTLPEAYGGAEASHVAYGLVAREIEAIDSGYRSAMSVQSSLAMYPIYAFGSDAQKSKFLPKMARGELIGCFGLTEADGGSDPGAMRTRADKFDGGYRLNGAKYWISNSPICDLAVVWAKLDGDITGFIVERDAPGFTTTEIGDKLSLRASITGDIGLADVFVPEANRLGRHGGGGVLLPRRQGLCRRPHPVRAASIGATTGAEETRGHDDRHRAGPGGRAGAWAQAGRRRLGPRSDLDDEAQ